MGIDSLARAPCCTGGKAGGLWRQEAIPPAETHRCKSFKSPVYVKVAKAGDLGGVPTASATQGNCSLEFSEDSNSLCHLNLPITLWGRNMCGFPLRLGIFYSWLFPPASTADIPNRNSSCQVLPLFLTNNLSNCPSPDVDCEQLNWEILYYSLLFSQSLPNSRCLVNVIEWMDGWLLSSLFELCLNWDWAKATHSKSRDPKSHDQ